jgi:hypothetical protein
MVQGRGQKRRIRGYHYIVDRTGTKRRVYGSKARGRIGGRQQGAGRMYGVVSGYGSYHRGRRYTGGKRIVTGYGAYKSGRGNKLFAGNPPTVQNSSSGFIIRHREYIQDMVSSQAFAGFAFPINPGLPSCFPWLSTVAQNFEEWVPRGIIFEFKTMSSDAVVSSNANAGLGTVIMATEYNPYNGNFANKQQMENYEFAQSCKPSCSIIHAVECSKKQNPMGSYFVRTQAVPSTQDQRLYDIGVFQIASQGMQGSAAVAIGEIWVSYEIELRKPRIPVGVAGDDDGNSNFDHIAIFNANVATTGVTPATPFGNSTTVPLYPSSGSTLGGVATGGAATAASFAYQPNSPTKNNFQGGIPVLVAGVPLGTLGPAAANTYYFPPGVSTGNFFVSYTAVYGTGGANWTPVFTAINCKALNLMDANTLTGQANNSATTSTSAIFQFSITVTAANASFTFPGSTGAYANPTWADLFVVQIPQVAN